VKYAYEDLSDTQFEDLVVALCQRLLGISVQRFSQGPDGGRDAKFVGTAELFPSKADPWAGTTIIQAKHTNGYNCSFSDSDFYSASSSNTVLGKEVPRVRKLREAKQVDHYMLFSNRRLSAISESDIRAYLAKGGGIPEASIYLCGVEQLEIFLKKFPDVVEIADLDPVDSPLIVSPQDLAEIVQALARHRESVQAVLDDPPVSRVYYERKNVLNNMTPEYAEAQQRRFLKETAEIQAFLAAPENTLLLQMYESVVDEFQLKIIAKRKDYQTFDSIMNYLIDLLFSRDPVLRQHGHKRLTRAILFYMYWNCDIGNQDDAETD
jgi:hypothetical protein